MKYLGMACKAGRVSACEPWRCANPASVECLQIKADRPAENYPKKFAKGTPPVKALEVMCADPARQWSEACDALYVATVASTPDDKARLRWIAENACDSRVGEACGMLGNWAEDEHGADSPESVVYYQRA